MNYQNFTKWNDKDLRLLFLKCLYLARDGVNDSAIHYVDVIFQETIKTRYGYGIAYPMGNPIGLWGFIRINLPNWWYPINLLDADTNIKNKNKLIELIIHECYHIYDPSLSEEQVEEKTMSHNLDWSNNFILRYNNL